jgi:transcriptional regulator with XRE-family HTH domain
MKKKEEKAETINDRVRQLRKELGFTQQEFATKLRLTHAQISAIELSKSIITEQNIFLICTPNLLKDGKAINYLWLRHGKYPKGTNPKKDKPQGMFIDPPATADGLPELYGNDRKALPVDERELIGVYRVLRPANKMIVRNNAKMILETQNNTETDLLGKSSEGKEKGEKTTPVGIGSRDSGETG